MKSRSVGLLLWIATFVLGGRAEDYGEGPRDPQNVPRTAQSKVEQGPVQLVVEVHPVPARVSDDLTLTLTIDYPRDTTIRAPAIRVSPEDFLVRHCQESRKADGGREILKQVCTLEPARTGHLTIPPWTVKFKSAQGKVSDAEESLQSGAIDVEVTSMVAGTASLEMLRQPAGFVALPKSRGLAGWFVAAAIAAAAVASAAFLLWTRMRRHPVVAVVGLSAQEEARKGLERLAEESWAARDVKRFYAELTAIVRRYLEHSTGIRTLEQTTEESLREIVERHSLSDQATTGLRRLLESADMVKFAAYRPAESETEEDFRQARLCVGLRVRAGGEP